MSPYLHHADVILLLETPVPWLPETHQLNDNCIVISLSDDPLYCQYPYRSFPNDISLTGDPNNTLCALLKKITASKKNSALIETKLNQYKKNAPLKQKIKDSLSQKSRAG
ncbi:hypothetical protein [Shewanella surugensis]|uniref:Uncharacterized protein n=1 Tax=Shewanella surugensis TaxID=212020 RepID=A0ABT0LJ14_9GAMM|nr:hypothetical protein [Shewanella surugensis]MCL1127694.1 hypothetical protein [Shewanella surugensis]